MEWVRGWNAQERVPLKPPRTRRRLEYAIQASPIPSKRSTSKVCKWVEQLARPLASRSLPITLALSSDLVA